jgi:NAD(P)-dependent dehydrogenase (short-subunit alcohol dehydrogenase family)
LKITEAATPLGRIGEVEDIGGVGAFLATKAAAYITGQSIVVDGGCVSTSRFG